MTIRKRKLLLLDDNFAPGMHEREIRSELLAERGRFVGVTPVHGDYSGATSLSTSNYYRGAAGLGPAGSSAMAMMLLARIDAVPSGTQVLAAKGTLGATGGYGFRSVGTALRFTAVNGAGSAVDSPSYTVGASDVGKMRHLVGVVSAGFVRLFVNGIEQGSGTAIAGFTAGDSSTRFAVGVDGAAANGAVNYAVVGLAVANTTAASSVDALANYYSVRGRRRITPLTGSTFVLGANRGQRDWTDTLAAIVLAKTGTPVDALAAWAWE